MIVSGGFAQPQSTLLIEWLVLMGKYLGFNMNASKSRFSAIGMFRGRGGFLNIFLSTWSEDLGVKMMENQWKKTPLNKVSESHAKRINLVIPTTMGCAAWLMALFRNTDSQTHSIQIPSPNRCAPQYLMLIQICMYSYRDDHVKTLCSVEKDCDK